MHQKSILKSLILKRDLYAVSKMYSKRKDIFTDNKCLALFELIFSQINKGDSFPDTAFWEAFFRGEKDSDAKVAYVNIRDDKSIATTNSILSLVHTQIDLNTKDKAKAIIKEYIATDGVHNLSDTYNRIEKLVDKLNDVRKSSMDAIDSDILFYFDSECGEVNDKALEIKKDYELRSSNEKGYFKFNTGFLPIDNVIGGVHSVSFIGLMGFAKNGKSTLLRQIAYNILCQGKNVMFVTLEMSKDSVTHSFLTLHANNTDFWGYNAPKIKVADIRSGSLSHSAKDFYLNKVIDDFFERGSLGTLYITQPTGDYTLSKLESDTRVLKSKMDIDVICIDYPALMTPDKGVKGRDTMNDLFRKLRHFSLVNHIPIIFPVQCNRAGYDNALKHKEHLFDITAIGDYSSIEKECTDLFSIIIPPELRDTGGAQIQHLISRESQLCAPLQINADLETGIMSVLSQISKEDKDSYMEVIDL